MKVHTIEIAAAIEEELKRFLKDWGGDAPMRFMRFLDLGGRQTDLYVYTAEKGAGPWMVIRIKSVMKSDQGECVQVFVNVTGTDKSMEEVLVSPEVWKLPALADRVLKFSKNDLLAKVAESGAALESGNAGSLASGDSDSGAESEGGSGSEEDEDDYEDIDTSGILAGDDDASSSFDFNPEDVIRESGSEEGEDDDQVEDPSELLRQLNEESDEEPEDEEKD